jgi:hypothetical protein
VTALMPLIMRSPSSKAEPRVACAIPISRSAEATVILRALTAGLRSGETLAGSPVSDSKPQC